MSDLFVALPGDAGFSGQMRIDVEFVLGRLHAAAGNGIMDRYLVACAAVQFWADLLAIHEQNGTKASMPEEIKRRFCHAERAVDRAALALLGAAATASDNPDNPDNLLSTYVALREDLALDALSKVLHLPMPECCGYDLADLELIAGDGKRLIDQIGLDRRILIVGIRTGGAYLAPFWKTVLAGLGVTDVQWCTVRPPVGGEAFMARASIGRQFVPEVVVVVDDQPDSGASMARVAAPLRTPDIDLWFSCVGRLWRGSAAHPVPAHSSVSRLCNHRSPRLWECLLPVKHPEFIARVRDISGLPGLPTHAHLHFRCPQGEARYGLGHAWLPWNDPRVLAGRRVLVNPHKTPIEIRGSDGKTLLHLRFVGESVFGRAEFLRVQNMDGAPPAWFVDGYVVTVDIGAARPFREQFHAASPSVRADLLAQVTNWLTIAARQVVAHAPDSPMGVETGSRWSAIVKVMRARCGCDPLLEIPQPFGAFLAVAVPWPGKTGRAIRSSLRYACGDWHWQVDSQGKLHRFQLEANWGDVSFPELELAAFALENRLALADARYLSSLCGLAYSSVQKCLSLAALTIAEARVRSVRTLSDDGRIALCQDFHQLIRTTSQLAGFETLSWT